MTVKQSQSVAQKFKVMPYQTAAVDAVLGCFEGQLRQERITYKIDPGRQNSGKLDLDEGFRNADIQLNEAQLLANIQKVQRRQNLPISKSLKNYMDAEKQNKDGTLKNKPNTYKPGAALNLDVEMETGTGKTYCYIKSIFEMNKRYGWSKFIIMVPSIAIREGVQQTFSSTADHFAQSYGGKKVRFFIYSSKPADLNKIEHFSSDATINVMIINIQAFNARGADNRRIYDELDDFQSRRPIDVISSNRPILILDEPQKMEGKATLEALPKFKPLFIMRYSATHKTIHNKIHRLDALDAYNQKLVKKISVRGIQVKGLAGTNAYLYLEGIDISRQAPVARIEIEKRLASGQIKRTLRRLNFRDDLKVESGGMDQYDGFTISQIDYNNDTVEFTNGHILHAGQASGDVSEHDIRRIQIRETIKAHLDKEKQLYALGIKVLSLFFIDQVAKYRDYNQEDTKGDYARIFEEEYRLLKEEYLNELAIDNEEYRKYLADIDATETHRGYFAIDKKSKRQIDPKTKMVKDDETGHKVETTDDVDAYDLILKDKKRLLSRGEPTRFIFSHSALREGWDNPNVFVMCMLKHSEHSISRRQEVGRGLRISVDQHGERQDNPATVHETNVLTVVASESYKEFVTGLQTEIVNTLSARPTKATEKYFTNKVLNTDDGDITVTPDMARQIYRYLIKNDYTNDSDEITQTYNEAKESDTLEALPEELQPYAEQVIKLIDSVLNPSSFGNLEDGRKPKTNPLNDNFEKKAFQELWQRINRKAVYRVEFDSSELVQKCISALDSELRVSPLTYVIEQGEQGDLLTDQELKDGDGFAKRRSETLSGKSAHSHVKYDLLGNLAEKVQLTRKTVAEILTSVQKATFDQFNSNPEHFISEAARIMQEQKATAVIEQLQYDEVSDRYDVDIFTANQTRQDFSKATEKLKKHVYDYCVVDSKIERSFVEELDISDEVVVYAKLPRGFQIPTPVGSYNPDWAISFQKGSVRHIYFVAETKGSMSKMMLRPMEEKRIECARKFFDHISQSVQEDQVKYDMVNDYAKLMGVVGQANQK